jgi:hypothetical protein
MQGVQAAMLPTAGCKLQQGKRGCPPGAQRLLQGCRQQDLKLQAAGCELQGCRLHGCRLHVAGCKGLSVRAQSAQLELRGCSQQGPRQQVAPCKSAGCKAAGSGLQVALGKAWCAQHIAAALAKRRKRSIVATTGPFLLKPLEVLSSCCQLSARAIDRFKPSVTCSGVQVRARAVTSQLQSCSRRQGAW